MRSLLGGWTPAVVSAFVAVELLAFPRVAAAQSKDSGGPARPQGAVVRSVAQTVPLSSDGEVALDRRATVRLDSAQRILFAGRYADAMTAFDAILASGDARGNYSLIAWAQHGMAVSAALAGQRERSRALYDELLRGPSLFPLADSIEAAVLTGRRGTAAALLDRFGETQPSTLGQQYTHSFRALDLALNANCKGAVDEISRAPDADRPLPQAIRGLCAAKAGHRAEAMMLRDSVLAQPLADHRSWPMIVARGVALRIR
jgi:hypothetical protein